MATNVMSCWPAGAAGFLVGVAWGLANLWVLARLLAAWLHPPRSKWRVVGWLLAKLAVVYPLAALFLYAYPGRAMSFGLGFSVVLLAAIARSLLIAQRPVALRTHGR